MYVRAHTCRQPRIRQIIISTLTYMSRAPEVVVEHINSNKHKQT
jgi:hypothetical protein